MTENDKIIEEAMAGKLPFESWEMLTGESAKAFAAFCVYRDLKADRNIRKAVDVFEPDAAKREKKYRGWRNWAAEYRWKERAVDYDKYHEGLKQTEIRKTIEAQGELHRAVTGKMLNVALEKLNTMNATELPVGAVAEWVQVSTKVDRDDAALYFSDGVSANGKGEAVQGELSFVSDFKGL